MPARLALEELARERLVEPRLRRRFLATSSCPSGRAPASRPRPEAVAAPSRSTSTMLASFPKPTPRRAALSTTGGAARTVGPAVRPVEPTPAAGAAAATPGVEPDARSGQLLRPVLQCSPCVDVLRQSEQDVPLLRFRC